MLDPAAFPSQPPPARADGVQPMSAIAAALWIVGATFGFLLLGSLLASLREDTGRDQTVLVVCQAAAYLLALFAILRVHGPDAPIREFIALRGTHAAFFPLALLAGASSAYWASWVLERVHRRFPDANSSSRLVEIFFEASPRGRIAMGLSIVVLGPVVEELLFRGAIFGPMARRYRMNIVIAWTAALFAVVHVEPRVMLPIFLLGLTMGFLRAASGSLWPSMLFHMGFNGAQFADLYTYAGPPAPNAKPEAMPPWEAAAGVGVFLACMALAIITANYTAAAHKARKSAAGV